MSSPLLPDARRGRIIAELRARGMLRVNELADLMGVAPVTLRRDMARLASEGVIRRLHGGAVLVDDRHTVVGAPPPSTRVGMLVPSLDFYWPEVIRGAQVVAEEHDATLVLRGTTYEDKDHRSHVQHLLDAGAEALLLAPDMTSPATAPLLEWLHHTGVPVVLVEREAAPAADAGPVESVTTDHTAGAGAAVRHLSALGHRRVGLVTNPGSPHRDEIARGWAAAVAECGLDADALSRHLRRPGPGDDGADVATLVREARASGTSALLVHADREAIAVVQHCQHQGIDIPGDLSVVAYDDEVAALVNPPLTAVRPPRTSVGRAAMHLVIDRLADSQRPAHKVVITPTLHVRASTAPPASRDARS